MILDKIVAATRQRVAREKAGLSLEDLKAQVEALPVSQDFPFEKALKAQDFNFICEVKKASPSKGIIAEDFPYLDIAKDYERAGAACISVLTEPDFFKGSPQYLQEIVAAVSIPVIRKDFIIDPYQIYQAKLWGASAVLLIVACLTDQELKDFQDLAHSLGLSALVEAHDEEEVQRALAIGARIVGVNNRNLKDFTVDIQNSIRLRHLAPQDVIFVSESGLNTAQDIQTLRDNDIHAALMGESFMRATDKVAKLAELYGPLRGSDGGKLDENKVDEAKPDEINQTVTAKFCGITSSDVIPALVEARPDYVGFVFAPSKRQVTQYQAQELIRALRACEAKALATETQDTRSQDLSAAGSAPSGLVTDSGTDTDNQRRIQTVGVFVNEPLDKLVEIAENLDLDVVQLHGDEDEAYIKHVKEALSCQVWKALPVRQQEDLERWQTSAADKLLFDAYHPDARGGSGETFNWDLLQGYQGKPYILAGGLTEFNLARAIRTLRPGGIDMSSGLEIDGKKDAQTIERVGRLLKTIRN